MSDDNENINTNVNTEIVDNIVLGNVSIAKDDITSVLTQKMNDVVSDYKKEYAATIFKDVEPEVVEYEFDNETDIDNEFDAELGTEEQ